MKTGDHFNEQGTSTDTQRDNTLAFNCTTNCKLLMIPTDALNEVNENLINVKLRDNITLLQKTPYFTRVHSKVLLPILSNARIKKFIYGDKIVGEGDLPAGLYVIKRGQCKVCIETKSTRSVKRMQFTKNNSMGVHNARARTLVSREEFNKKSNNVLYQNNIPLANLIENNTFGGKSLLPINPLADEKSSRSLLSVIADSAEVEVLIITRDLLGYLTGEQRVISSS